MAGEFTTPNGQVSELSLPQPQAVPVESDGDFYSEPPAVHPYSKEVRIKHYLDEGFTLYAGCGEVKAECLGLETPTDEQTGLPLASLVVDAPSSSANVSFSDFHHQFHPRATLQGDDAAQAVRISRGQQLPRWLHEHYHSFFAGPALPQTREEAFAACVLACAGVIPKQIIDFTRQGPTVRSAKRYEYEALADSIRFEGSHRWDKGRFQRNRVGIFFANYAVEQAIEDEMPRHVIREFLSSADEEVRLKRGNQMLRHAVGMSVDPVRPLFRELRKEGLITGDSPDLWPVVTQYFVSARLPDYHIALRQRFNTAQVAC